MKSKNLRLPLVFTLSKHIVRLCIAISLTLIGFAPAASAIEEINPDDGTVQTLPEHSPLLLPGLVNFTPHCPIERSPTGSCQVRCRISNDGLGHGCLGTACRREIGGWSCCKWGNDDNPCFWTCIRVNKRGDFERRVEDCDGIISR